jgi:DNA-binding MarR family transcriptional regulator
MAERRSLEDLVAVRIVRIAEVIARLAIRTIEKRFGLRNTDLRLMNLLDGKQGVTVNEIARRARIDKAWVSRSLRELEACGLVARRTHRPDSRVRVVSLSPKGRALLARVRPLAAAHERRLLAGLNESSFKSQLERLLMNADAMLERE